MLVQASWTEEGRVVFRLYRTGAEAANGMRGTRHLRNVKSAFLARIFIPLRRREFTKSFTVRGLLLSRNPMSPITCIANDVIPRTVTS